MKRPTPKVEKHIKYDSDLAKRIEEQAESENKHFTEWVIEASRFRIEIIDKAKEQPQLAPQSLEQPQQYPTETLGAR